MAIARDSNSSAQSNATTGLTTAHTISGANRLLMYGIVSFISGTNLLTSVKYNGTAATQLDYIVYDAGGRDDDLYLYGLINPDTGSNNIVTVYSASTFTREANSSYTGVSQTGLPNSINNGEDSGGTSPLTVSTTVVASDAWLAGTFSGNAATIAAGTGTSKVVGAEAFNGFFDSNGTVGTGSQSLQVTWGGSNNVGGIVASIAPPGAAVQNRPPGITGTGAFMIV